MSRYNDFLSRIIDESLIPRGIFIHFAFSIVFRITARAGVGNKKESEKPGCGFAAVGEFLFLPGPSERGQRRTR